MTNPNTAPSADSDGGAEKMSQALEALNLAREYVDNASSCMYDGTNGHGIRKEALRRLFVIDAAIASLKSTAQTGGEAVAPEAKADRAVFEQWYDAQPDGKLSPWDVWQSAIQHAIKSGHACTFALDNGGNLYRRYKEPQCAPPAPPAPPAPLPGKPLTKDQIAALLPLIKAEVDTLSDEGRYTFAGWLPIAVRLIEKHHGIAALSAQAAPEYRTGFDEAPSTFNQEDAAPADYPPQSEIEAIAERLGATDPDDSLWRDFAHAAIDADRAQRSGVSADPLPDLDVDLPDRVIDQLMHDAGVSLMEPWSEQEMYDFANTVKREVLARVPSKMLATSPQHQVKKGEPS